LATAEIFITAEQRLWAAEGAVPTERRILLKGEGTHVRVQEVGEGTPVLFMHGGPGASGSVWASLAARLPGLRCILVDRPGTGLSDPLPIQRAQDVRPQSERLVVDILDALEVDRAHLVGSSHGGYMALLAGLRHPDRVDRTVLMGCPGFVEGMATTIADRIFLLPGMAWLIARLPTSERGLLNSFRGLGHGALIDAGGLKPEFVQMGLALMRHTPTMAEELKVMAKMGTTFRGFDPSLTIRDEELAYCRSPTLLYWGSKDPYGAGALARGLEAALPDAKLQLHDDFGHLPWLDDPELAATAVMGHLRPTHHAAPIQ